MTVQVDSCPGFDIPPLRLFAVLDRSLKYRVHLGLTVHGLAACAMQTRSMCAALVLCSILSYRICDPTTSYSMPNVSRIICHNSWKTGAWKGLNLWDQGRIRHDTVEACKGHMPCQANIGKKQNKGAGTE